MKTKYVMLESARYVIDDDGEWVIVSTPEVVELNSSIINAFSGNEKKYVNSKTVLCDIKFIQRDSDDENDNHTLNYHVQCTDGQLRGNMELILKTLEELKSTVDVEENNQNTIKI